MFYLTPHSKCLKRPALKDLRPVRGAFNPSLASHSPLTHPTLKDFSNSSFLYQQLDVSLLAIRRFSYWLVREKLLAS